jgi:hypothetical protein
MKTVGDMYDTLRVEDHFNAGVYNNFWDKFEKAVTLFHQKRKRPKDKRMLIPTLAGVAKNEKEEFWELTREFVRSHLILK